MSLTAFTFLLIFVSFSVWSLLKGPFWAVLLYIHVYFNMPDHQFWRTEVPDLRWSFITLVVLLASCLIHQKELSSRKLFSSLVSKELLLFYCLILVTGYFSQFPEFAARDIYFFFGYIVIYFFLLKVVRSLDQLVIILGWIILETFQLARLAHGRYHGGRLEGIGLPDASSANLFGAFITMVLPFFLPFLFSSNKKIRILAIILAPLIVNAFIMCSSRGAFLGMFTTTLLLMYLVYAQHGKVINKKAVFVYLLIAMVGFWLLLSPEYKERLFSLTDDNIENVSSGRTDIWLYGIRMAFDYPFGAGPAGFMELSPIYIPQEFIQQAVGKRDAHNTYLLVLVEQGYAGLLLYFVLIATIYRGFHRSWKSLRSAECSMGGENAIFQVKAEYVHFALLASFTTFVGSIVFSSRLYFEFFYILLSLIVIYFLLVKENSVEQEQV